MSITLGAKEFSLYGVLDVARRRLLYFLVPAAVAGAACVLGVMSLPVRYRAQALLASQAPAAQAYIPGGSWNPRIQDQLVTIREALYSPAVLEETIREFRLGNTNGQPLSARAIEEVKSHVKVTMDTEDSFYIGYEGREDVEAAGVANRLAELFTQYFARMGDQRVQDTAGFLDAEVARLRRKLDEQERRLTHYKLNAANELPDNRDANMRSLDSVRFQLQSDTDRMATDQARMSAVIAEMKDLEQQGVLKPVVPNPKDKSPEEARLDDLKLQLKQAEAKYTEKHPEVTRLKKEIRDLEALLVSQPAPKGSPDLSPARMRYLQLKGERESLEQRIKSYQTEIAHLSGEMGLYQRRLTSAPVHETQVSDLGRDYDSTRNQYNALLEKQQQARLAGRLQKENRGMSFRIVEPALVPKAPAGLPRSLLLAAGLLASLGLGLGLAFAREQMDTSFNTIDEFQAFTNLPVLTTIPTISADPATALTPPKSLEARLRRTTNGAAALPLPMVELHGHRLIALSDPNSVAAEQYRILALKARQQLGKTEAPVLLMTSSVGGEGKTLTTLNLGFVLANTEERPVLLIEGDLRKPRMHEYLSLKPSKGFSDLLREPDDDLSKYTWKIGNLCVLSGGTSLANPVELLASSRARALFTRLRREFGLIVVDGPPTLPIVDAHILAGLADGVLLVVRARHTRRELFQRAVESFHASNILGVVLNDVDYQRSRYGYAYQYYSKHYLAAK